MITIEGVRNYSYSLIKTKHIFNAINDALLSGSDTHPGTRRFIIVDKNVQNLYGDKLVHYFEKRKVHTYIKVVDAGDMNKSEREFISIFGDLCKFDLMRRSEPIIAIGGGVVTDLAGFVASTYRRGVPHVKVPTTLMGYIDASVGIKNGVNFGPFKNRMGSFEIPEKVILDKSFLTTLDRRNLVNGIGEIIKLAVILDADLFEDLVRGGRSLITNRFQDDIGQKVLDKSIVGMVNELSPNLYETDLQRKVDFGHTFSLVIESTSNYEIMHGEAVAIDVLFSSYLSFQRGLISRMEFERIANLFRALGLPMWSRHMSAELFWKGVEERVMHRDGKQLIPVPVGIGACDFINDLKWDEICSATDVMRALFSDSDVA